MSNHIPVISKSVILALTVVCMGIHCKSLVESRETLMVTSGTFVGYTIIQAVTIVALFLGSPISKRVDIIFCLIGCVMFLVSGGLLIQYYNDILLGRTEDDKLAYTKGILALVNGVLYLVSTIYSCKV